MELTGGAVNTEHGSIRATDGISQGVIVGVGCRNGTADICICCGIFCHRPRRACSFGETWGAIFVYICDVDRDINRVCEFTIRDGNPHRIGGLGFIIQRRTGLELTGGAVNTERCGICATEGIGERGIRINICRSDSSTDVCVRCGVLCYRTGRGVSCETWCLVDICDTDCDGGRIRQVITIRGSHCHGIGGFCFIV